MTGPAPGLGLTGLAAVQLAPVACVGLLYALRVRSLRRSPAPVPAWRQACFCAGLATIALALTALARPSEELLLAHVAQHLLVADIAALLLVLGVTGPLLAPSLGLPLLSRLTALANPLIAFPLWVLSVWLWQLPALQESALQHPAVHVLEHAMLLAAGVNMWMCLLGPLPAPRWFGNLGRLGYILAVRLTGAALGNVLLWSGAVFYPAYTTGDLAWHVSPLADQNLAGALLLAEQGLMALALFCWLFLRAGEAPRARPQARAEPLERA